MRRAFCPLRTEGGVHRPRTWAGVLVLALLSSVGCYRPPYVTVKPKIEIGQSTLAVIPFREGELTYLASQRGNELSAMIAFLVTRALHEGQFGFVSGGKTIGDQVDSALIESRDYRAIASKLGVRYLMIGDIREFRTRDAKAVNILRGSIVVSYQVLEVNEGVRVVWSEDRASFHYPRGGAGMAQFFAASETTEECIERNTLREAALRLSRLFYRHKVPRYEKPRSKL